MHEPNRVRFGWLTPALALFVAIDIATFWNQAWIIFRGAPFNLSLLVLGLVITSTFYIAASVTFPRLTETETDKVDLDQHFWTHRKTVFVCILAANLMVATFMLLLAQGNAEFARLASSVRLWVGVAFFIGCSATAAFARSRKVVKIALIVVLLYSMWQVSNSATLLIQAGGWAPALTAE